MTIFQGKLKKKYMAFDLIIQYDFRNKLESFNNNEKKYVQKLIFQINFNYSYHRFRSEI